MRTGLSMIMQILTPEAAALVNHATAEAGRRNHNQTTPLHVAASLLAAPRGFLQQACVRSHPKSSHPLQCRALELCFSVALERLPSASSAVLEPPVSNALMAALKRAQAHQRRGCPEQLQPPLLAVKVELEQVVVSILDDPSVSRVMREAGFSSPAVKETIEQLLNNNGSGGSYQNPASLDVGFRRSMLPTNPVPMPFNRNLEVGPNVGETVRLFSDDLEFTSTNSGNNFLQIGNRLGMNGCFGSSVESFYSVDNAARMPPCCSKCVRDYEHELESSSVEAKRNLPKWLQNAKAQRGETEMESETKMPLRMVNDQKLQKKWSDICARIHPKGNQIPSFARTGTGFVPVFKPNRVLCRSQTGQQQESPSSPVRTELVLGQKEVREDLRVKDYSRCISSEPRAKGDESPKGKFVNSTDTDSFKKLLKGLMKKAWWQPEVAFTIATTVTQCGSKGGRWLLFAGPDRVGKLKMASVLAEHICGAEPIAICLASRRDEDKMDFEFRGKTVLDRIVETVRRNPASVIVLSDIDEADMLVHRGIKEAMERGWLTDSHGREVRVGNVIFVLTGNWSTNNEDEMVDTQRLHTISTGDWQLKLTVCTKRSKRRADWLLEGDMSTKQQKKVGTELSLDLNLVVDSEEDRTDTSDLTIEQGDENLHFPLPLVSVPHDLAGPSNGVIIFKPVQFRLIRREIEKTVKNAFSTVVDKKLHIEIDEPTLDNIISGLWFGKMNLEDWAEQVLVPSFHKLARHLPSPLVEDLVAHLEPDRDFDQANERQDLLPSKISVIVLESRL